MSDAPFPLAAYAVPFPADSRQSRQIRETLRRNAVRAGVRKPTKADLARESKAIDKARGWRVAVGSTEAGRDCPVGNVSNIVGVDPGALGGYAWWGWVSGAGGEDRYEFLSAGDGLPEFPRLIPFDGEMVEMGPCLVILEDQRGFRPHIDKTTGKLKRGGSVSEHSAGRHWGEAYGVLATVCRERGWPLVCVQPKTWQRAMFAGVPSRDPWSGAYLDTKGRAVGALHGHLPRLDGKWSRQQFGFRRHLTDDFYGPQGGLKDGRVDAACIGAWPMVVPGLLAEIMAACREARA